MIGELVVGLGLVILLAVGAAYLRPVGELLGAGRQIHAVANKLMRPEPPVERQNTRPPLWRRLASTLSAAWGPFKARVGNCIFLRPCGDSLLDPKSKMHLTLYGLFILAMATLEGFAWGYLGWLFAHQSFLRFLAAGCIFILVFALVWGMDVSLALHDSLVERHSREFDIPFERRGPGLKLAIPLRVLMLAGSLVIAAPLLANVIFAGDIAAELRRQGTTAIAKWRTDNAEKHAAAVQNIDQTINRLQDRYDHEIVGKGIGHGIGHGIEARNLEAQIASRRLDRQAEILAGQNELNAFNVDAANWQTDPDTLQQKWNVVVPRMTVLQNSSALNSLSKRDDYRSVEWAIRFLFLLSFVSVVICKLYESYPVSLYNSSTLQGLRERLNPNYRGYAEPFYREMLDGENRKRREDLTALKVREPELISAVASCKEVADKSYEVAEAAQQSLEDKTAKRDLHQKRMERSAEDLKSYRQDMHPPVTRHLLHEELWNARAEHETQFAEMDAEYGIYVRRAERTKVEFDERNTELNRAAQQLHELRNRMAELESSLTAESFRSILRRPLAKNAQAAD